MIYRIKKDWKIFFFIVVLAAFIECNERHKDEKQMKIETKVQKTERMLIDTLKKCGLNDYLDSAYLYMYVYFGGESIVRCGSTNLDSILPYIIKRKLIYQDLTLTQVRIVKERSWIFLSVTPLIKDSILSCDMVDGPTLPNEIVFDYKTKKLIQFMYDEHSWLKITSPNLIKDYDDKLKKIVEMDGLEPNKRFKLLWSKIKSAPPTGAGVH